MAYGTESIPRVDRIVGPGNAYVTEAKRQVAGTVGIDGLAGPSELTIVADGDIDIDMAALDLIAQAEHDPQARTFFITPDPELDRAGWRKALDEAIWRTPAGARSSTRRCGHTKAVLVRDLDQAADVVNDLASEHLQILLPDPERVPARRAQRRRRCSSAMERGAVRRLRRRLEPRAAHRGDRAVLERAARGRLRHGRARWSRWTPARRPGSRPAPRPSRTPRVSSVTPAPWTRAPAPPRSWNREPRGRSLAPGCATSSPTCLRSWRWSRGSTPTSVHTRLPQGFSDALADAIRDLPLNRYPDGQMTRLREEVAAHHGHPFEGTWTANGSNEVLTELLLAYGGPGQRAVDLRTHVPAALAPVVAHAHRGDRAPSSPTRSSSTSTRSSRPWPTNPTWCSCARPTTRPATPSPWRRSPNSRTRRRR